MYIDYEKQIEETKNDINYEEYMEESHRNRAEGWKYAKLTGHQNEILIAEEIKSNENLQKRILDYANVAESTNIYKVECGGTSQKKVDSVFEGKKTTSKTDVYLYLQNGEKINISIKKDKQGQVFLIGIDNFINGFKLQYNTTISKEVERAIKLYFGSAEDIPEIIEKYSSSKNKDLELRKHRLVADTLREYNPKLSEELLSWFKQNKFQIFDFCFSRGLSKKSDDWVDILWYKNAIKTDYLNLDNLINLQKIKNNIKGYDIYYGKGNGGSAIQLPFGFVQWHSPKKTIPGQLQFHHDYEKIMKLNSMQ